MRSTGSSNCSQPSSSTRLLRGLGDAANTFSTWAFWFWLNVRPMTLTSYFSSARLSVAPQPQPMSSKRHAGLQPQLAQRQIDLGDLCLFQRHVVALEVRAAVGLRRVQEQPEELIGQVVVRLHVLEVRLQGSGVAGRFWQVRGL